jgi:hypothetical protein
MMSDGAAMTASLPSPTIHSPKAIVLLVPSVIALSWAGAAPPVLV